MRLIDVMNRRFRFVSMKLKSLPTSRAEVQKGELNFSILGTSKKFIATKGRGEKTSEEDGRFSLLSVLQAFAMLHAFYKNSILTALL